MRTIQLIKSQTLVGYNDGLALQQTHAAALEKTEQKIATLLFLQHAPVYTLGRATKKDHLLCSEETLAARTGAEVVNADRGGSVTYHAPGQLTAYLLLNLRVWELGIHEHLFKLEDCAIQALRGFGIESERKDGMTGAWARDEKVCAIGVSARRWVTYHGLSLNVNIDLKPFFEVVPCGLQKGVTSMAKILQHEVPMSAVETALAAAFGAVYSAEVRSASC